MSRIECQSSWLCAIVLAALTSLAAAQDGSPTLEQLEEKLQANIESLDGAKLDETRQLIADIEKRTHELSGEKSWPHRLRIAEARAAVARLDAGELKPAQAAFEALVDDVPAGEPVRLEALHRLFLQEAARQTISLDTVAKLLNELELARQRDPIRFAQGQYEAIAPLFAQAVATVQAQQQSPEKTAELLEVALRRLADELKERAVVPGVAQLVEFGQVAFAEQRNDDARLEATLSSLQPVVESDEVAEIWRALYWNKWAEQHIRRRRYAEAFDSLQKMTDSAVRLDSLEIYAIAQTQLGHLSLSMGDYAEAKRILESPDLLKAYAHSSDMAKVCTWKVNRANALLSERAIFPARQLLHEAQQAALAANNRSELEALVRNNLGINYYLAGELTTAAELLTQNFEEKTQTEVGPISLAESRINLGWIALAQSDPAAAKSQFLTAADMVKQAADQRHPRYAEALSCAARATALLGDRGQAVALIRQAEALSFAQTRSYLETSWSTQDRLAIVQEARVHPESLAWPGVFDTFLELAPQIGISSNEQYGVVARWKGLLDAFEGRDRSAIPPETREAEARLSAQLREAYFRKVPLAQRGRVQAEIRTLEDQLRSIRRILRPIRTSETSPAASGESDSEDAEQSAQTQIQLSEGQALLDIIQIRKYRTPTPTAFGADSEFLGYVTSPDGKCHRVSLGQGDQLEALIGQWRQAIIDESPEERQLAGQVASLVQRPVIELMPRLKQLIVRSDGATYLLPWSALPGVEQKSYWIENITIETVRTLGLNRSSDTKTPSEPRPSILLVGNVDYGKSSSQWPALPNCLKEIQTVGSVFTQTFPDGDVVQLEQKRASEGELIRQMPGKRYIHLATHGYFLRRESSDAFSISGATSLLNSGIIVAPQESDGAYDEYLSAAEIAPLDLSSTDLVMLSACETGLGKFRAGQGMEGLVTSFQNAGARHVISTLWKVEDESAALVSENFYKHLWPEHATGCASALRRAQLDLLHSHDSYLRRPVAWAGFTISSIAPEG